MLKIFGKTIRAIARSLTNLLGKLFKTSKTIPPMIGPNLESIAEMIESIDTPFVERKHMLEIFPGHVTYAFNASGTPDFKKCFEIFNKMAADYREVPELRIAAIESGISAPINLSRMFFEKVKSMHANSQPTIVDTFAKGLWNDIGDPNLILSRLLDIAENVQNPKDLRQTAFSAVHNIRGWFEHIGSGYQQPDSISSRAAKLEHLAL